MESACEVSLAKWMARRSVLLMGVGVGVVGVLLHGVSCRWGSSMMAQAWSRGRISRSLYSSKKCRLSSSNTRRDMGEVVLLVVVLVLVLRRMVP